jgi:hypothetical protein
VDFNTEKMTKGDFVKLAKELADRLGTRGIAECLLDAAHGALDTVMKEGKDDECLLNQLRMLRGGWHFLGDGLTALCKKTDDYCGLPRRKGQK